MSRPRSIADVVRALPPEGLAELVRLRPDLAHPRPHDLAELVDRATGSASTQLAIEGLDAFTRRTCLALAATEDAISTRHLAALMGAERSSVAAAVSALARRALVWGSDRSWHLTRAARAAFGPYPAGLAPVSAVPLTDAEVDARVVEAGQEAREVLDRLLWTNPTGRVLNPDRRGDVNSTRPVDRLLGHRLLRPLDQETIILPREVALRLRGGRLFDDEVPEKIPAWPVAEPATTSDRAAEGSAFEAVRQLEALVEALGRLQPRPLATGAISRRDSASLFAEVGDSGRGLLLLLLAQQLGLVASQGQAWLPTTAWDRWLERPDWEHWTSLRAAWLALETWPDPEAPVLAAGALAWAAPLRRLAFDQLASAAPGTPVDPDLLARRIEWLRPGWSRLDLPAACRQLVEECRTLGLVALGRRTSLVDATDDPGFPEPVRQFMVQSDLTAVAPGPLHHEVARTMALLADRESTGGGGVHRFTATSLRRALDAGWTADELHGWLTEHSSTPLPGALDYLVTDVARRHGQVQVAPVAAVVTVDDPAVVESLVTSPRAAGLGLRRLAPTVLSSAAEPAELVEFLREAGLAPVATDEFGQRRTTPAPRRSRPPAPAARPAAEIDPAALVSELLSREEGAQHATQQAAMVDLLRAQVAEPGWLSIDYVAADGAPRTMTARVMALSGGQVRLMQKAQGPLTLPLSRLISATRVT